MVGDEFSNRLRFLRLSLIPEASSLAASLISAKINIGLYKNKNVQAESYF